MNILVCGHMDMRYNSMHHFSMRQLVMWHMSMWDIFRVRVGVALDLGLG